jgi:hypothetical protein
MGVGGTVAFSKNDLKRKRYAEDPEFRARILGYNRAYYAAHRDEINTQRRRQWVEHPSRKETQRRYYLRSQNRRRSLLKHCYGMSLEEYERLLARQGSACAICGKRSAKTLCVDHCHATGRVRGLLCHKCNLGIGYLDDDPGLMRAAIAYVSRRQEDQLP